MLFLDQWTNEIAKVIADPSLFLAETCKPPDLLNEVSINTDDRLGSPLGRSPWTFFRHNRFSSNLYHASHSVQPSGYQPMLGTTIILRTTQGNIQTFQKFFRRLLISVTTILRMNLVGDKCKEPHSAAIRVRLEETPERPGDFQLTILFDSAECVKPITFGSGLLSSRRPIVTEARRTRADEPSKIDSIEWYSNGEYDPSDPRDWSTAELLRREQIARYNDAVMCGFIPC